MVRSSIHSPALWRSLMPLYVAAAAILLADQISKAYVVGLLGTQAGNFQPIFGDVLWLRMVHNSGAAFGMLPDASIVFAVAAVVVVIGIVFYSHKLAAASWLVRIAIGLELGGALGNLIDRVHYGYVVDFIDFRLWPNIWPFVFNISDAAITIGVVLLLWHFVIGTGRQPAPSQPEHKTDDRAIE